MNSGHPPPRRAGVLGGMGPEATLAFLEKFYALSRGRREQTRPSLLVAIEPTVPDRNEAWRGVGASPAATMAAIGRRLKRAGADFCIMPCVTAHGFLDDFERRAGLPLLAMPTVVAEALSTDSGTRGTIGLLATATTLEMKLFQHAFACHSLSVIVPEATEQDTLMRAIYTIKRGGDPRAEVCAVAAALVARGAQTLLVGCTDLSVLGPLHLDGHTSVDALDLLARRCLAELEPARG